MERVEEWVGKAFDTGYVAHPCARVAPEELRARLQEACAVVADAVCRYGVEGVAVSWNGGKDATALLQVVRLALESAKWRRAGTEGEGRPLALAELQAITFVDEEDFEEVKAFTRGEAARYAMRLEALGSDMRPELARFLATRPELRCILMGVREDDPYCKELGHFAESDTALGWPAFMRANPIIHWSYDDIWAFLLGFRFPYCHLYDDGYTSLGTVGRTVRNERLRATEGMEERYGSAMGGRGGDYLPAWCLEDDSSERAGRLPRQ